MDELTRCGCGFQYNPQLPGDTGRRIGRCPMCEAAYWYERWDTLRKALGEHYEDLHEEMAEALDALSDAEGKARDFVESQIRRRIHRFKKVARDLRDRKNRVLGIGDWMEAHHEVLRAREETVP